jgi:site-specific DNA recombinase
MMKAAVWWRVSTDTQKEISPDTQINEAMALAQTEGYEVPQEYVIGTDWHSLSVWDSPSMDQMKELIRSRAIKAVFMYDADRGPSKPAHRLLFRALCEEYGVSIRCKYGQVPDGDMGEVMEFLSAWSKEKQVNRAQQGARDGLRDRAKIKGLPVNGHAPYGYQLRYEINQDKKCPVAWEPNPLTYPVASQIWQLALSGQSLLRICKVLTEEGIPTPSGRQKWQRSTLQSFFKNPIYSGQYYALRRERAAPQKRQGLTYGHSSSTAIPEELWVRLDFPVLSPIVSPEEWQQVQANMKRNKEESQVNRNGFYLLAGMVFCSHDGRRWSGYTGGKGRRHVWYYRCTLVKGLGNCPSHKLYGPTLEAEVWDSFIAFLDDPEKYLAEMARLKGNNTSTLDDVQATIKTLEGKLNKVYTMETDLALKNVHGDLSDEAYHRAGAMLKAEGTHYQEEIARQQSTLAALEQSRDALDTLVTLRNQIRGKLQDATPETRRWVLQSFGTRIIVGPQGIEEISVGAMRDRTRVQNISVLR